jgi:hypothetical protein
MAVRTRHTERRGGENIPQQAHAGLGTGQGGRSSVVGQMISSLKQCRVGSGKTTVDVEVEAGYAATTAKSVTNAAKNEIWSCIIAWRLGN